MKKIIDKTMASLGLQNQRLRTGNTASKLTFSICVVLSWTSFGKHSILILSKLRILFWGIIYNVSRILWLWKAVWSVLQRKIQVCLAQLGDPRSKLSKKRFEYSIYISGQLALSACCLLCRTHRTRAIITRSWLETALEY